MLEAGVGCKGETSNTDEWHKRLSAGHSYRAREIRRTPPGSLAVLVHSHAANKDKPETG
uniref:Macaca fascicularis brain cDNA clone: QmoA-11617, similar to human ribosomal protein L37 (RPL37), mRNA, RefSeq: NM_000997.2 n=1 Tax=Macaca fascicularis TaxID=9541 RepID=I7GJ49_MACFA|nr:unnamed protein product [Macaca fascicularis]